MRIFKTEKRLTKITNTALARQKSLKLILENIHDPHNVSAIFRTCDAVGVAKVDLVYNSEKFPRIGKASSSSANKWIEIEKHTSAEECCSKLRERGFKIYASMLDEKAIDFYSLDLTTPIAIVMGNEHRGVTKEFQDLVDGTFYIPMKGMIQSLNVSVATAVILYEAMRQRSLKGMYEQSEYSKEELDKIIDRWCEK